MFNSYDVYSNFWRLPAGIKLEMDEVVPTSLRGHELWAQFFISAYNTESNDLKILICWRKSEVSFHKISVCNNILKFG